MHAHEARLTLDLVRALLTDQMPDLAALPLRRVGQAGTDNHLFRLGSDHLLRFPRLPHADSQGDRIARFLPALAPALPLPVPLPLRMGKPGRGYPFGWMLTPWLPGQPAPPDLTDPAAARALAATLQALRAQPLPPDAPRRQGESLTERLAGLAPLIPSVTEAEPGRLSALLDQLAPLKPYVGPPVWTHGDLHGLNFLLSRGRLTALIDWGTLGAGDPAIDLLPAYMVFGGAARVAFLDAMAPDAEALSRARAIALSKVIRGLPYYRHTNPGFHAILRASLPRVLAGP